MRKWRKPFTNEPRFDCPAQVAIATGVNFTNLLADVLTVLKILARGASLEAVPFIRSRLLLY